MQRSSQLRVRLKLSFPIKGEAPRSMDTWSDIDKVMRGNQRLAGSQVAVSRF
jgi:hypothetical protein